MAAITVGMLNVWTGSLQGEAGDLVLPLERDKGTQWVVCPPALSGFQEDYSQLPYAG